MNFLAHLVLAGDDEALRLGAMLGDFVRGKAPLAAFDPELRTGILLHRHIDAHTDSLPEIRALREWFPPRFRRYAGIIIDLAVDHELARRWDDHHEQPLAEFDDDVRRMLARHESIVPDGLRRFMDYADRRGLFAAYRDPAEVLHSLRGIGRRLSRPNPLRESGDIWDDLQPLVAANFTAIFGQVQSDAAAWLKSRSTITGS
jgi:acyl carrier protein phosphodiesterase